MRRQASWYVKSNKPDVIHIIDESNDTGSVSVTNDAENVVRAVVDRFGNKRILYTDTMGNVDELVHDNGVFTGFAPGPR